MAIYLYRCTHCGEFEQEHAMSSGPLRECPSCGSPVTRLIAGGTAASVKGGAAPSACGRDTRCCGRSTGCDTPQCHGH